MGFTDFIKSLFGDKSGRDLKKIMPIVDKIYECHPEMLEINKTESERRELLRPFEITPTDGFIYDLRQTPIFQKSFTF